MPAHHAYLAAAARLALRGHGGAEPNPLVGCLIVSPEGGIVGWGYHRRCGGPHAEIVALRRAGPRAAGATVYVTLEPCNHTGRTGPCSEALIKAGVARAVVARLEPGAVAAGGAKHLRTAGIHVDTCADIPPRPAAVAVSDPYVYRTRSGLPWVVAKWAQTVDGRIATRSGESRWISNAASQRLLHRERGRVDAILTGIGTVIADDPLLTARGVRPRRVARRVVIDPDLDIPLESRLVTTTREAPTIVACGEAHLSEPSPRAAALVSAGVELIGAPMDGTRLRLADVLRALVPRHETTNVLVDAGPGLLGELFRQRLVNEAWVFVAPRLFGDEHALPCVRGLTVEALTDGVALSLSHVRRRGGDVILRYAVGRDQ
ncbi:MAG: bifunctional diaminohydroxyphosphoribosylaminopyrimidine deaminase/5-amino-6-(5-phosphoribosylamino)uracil reductase RibD, partial [Planctomycetota bacterium]